ncbi:response regulator [Deinococcus hopiensis]|uniref:response regulator n=1 Tax=Deinococcus hopiensis TaxID=309885 RepID=UPI001482803A|nr:response regulator [Deinococcus hopiensis]
MIPGAAVCSLLLVDDSDTDVFLVESALAEFGASFKMEVARDGVEAIEALQTGPDPDLVLLDVNMPRMNGLEVLQALNGNMRGMRVVVWSSGWQARDVQGVLDAGAKAYLQKPSSYRALVTLLGSFLQDCA